MDGNPEELNDVLVEVLVEMLDGELDEGTDIVLDEDIDEVAGSKLVEGVTVAFWVGAPPAQYPRQAATYPGSG